jgi:hypothetical protein
MSSDAATGSLRRFIEAHGDALRAEAVAALPPSLAAADPKIVLENDVYTVGRTLDFCMPGNAEREAIQIPFIGIDELRDRDKAEFDDDCGMRW